MLPLLVCVLIAGCARERGVAQAEIGHVPGTAVQNPGAPAARVGGRVITEGELMAEARAPLATVESRYAEEVHNLKVRTLEGLIEKRLLEDRASKEGITVDALIQREITSNVPEPAEAYLHAVYEQTKANKGSLPPFSEVKAEIASFVKSQTFQSLRQAYVARLKAEASVEILLPPFLPPKVELKAVGPSHGDASAPVTIVEFSDYECDFCGSVEPTVKRLLDQYPGKVRVVFQSFPLSIHPHAQKSSEAALCAGEQGRYWEMHEKLFANQKALATENLKAHARALGLDPLVFDRCLDSGRMAPVVEKNRRLGESVGVNSTPSFFVNGRLLTGAQPFERFLEIIDYELSPPKR
jgi:protein-disulfide isomerase